MSSFSGQGEPGPGGDELGLGGVGFLLGAAHRAHRRQWEAQLADLGVSAPQAAVLRAIAAEPGQGVRGIARRIGTDPMNAQRIIESLLAAGLCQAGHDPGDARRRPLHPTPEGGRVAEEVAGRARLAERHLADTLGEEGYRSLLAALEILIGDARYEQGPG